MKKGYSFDEMAKKVDGVVIGPATSVLNEIPRFGDTTGDLLIGGLKYQTSATDTTNGALMAVGAFGLGGGLLTVTDANLVPLGGSFTVMTPPFTNAPATGLYFTLYSVTDATDGSQMAVSFTGGAPTRHFRTKSAGVWSAWQEVWTTGNLVKTTSAVDTTAGSMLKVGDFGLGGTGLITPTDLDTITNTGLYYTNTADASSPFPNSAMTIQHIAIGISSATQVAIRQSADRMWFRRKSAGTWNPWVELWTSNSNITQNLAQEKNQALGNATGAFTVYPASGANMSATSTGATTWNFDMLGLVTGYATSWTLTLTNGGAFAQTWTSVKWAGGVAPTLTTAGTDILVFTHDGTTLRGYLSAKDSK